MKAKDFEAKFWEVEKIVIVLRCPEDQEVGEYDYERASSGNSTLTELKNGRLKLLNKNTIQYVIHNGDVATPNGRTKLSSIRESYN